ncbi:MAG: cobalt transporter CbiM [Thermodesulfobacteriota bacterium]|nr:MAG: cobalt transporter CbiM [Thermodesulfobacteriota bacterium]
MHIPDGYLSPATCVVFYGAMAPVWYISSRKVDRGLKARDMARLSFAAAFSFVIMMFNIPVPGGSSGHMVGAAVAAIVLGPWAAVAALTLAVALQAFIFGDGGVTALAANSFNMAFIMSFTGYFIYSGLTLGSPGVKRRFFASAAAGYVSVNVAALAVALELGVQPLVAHSPAGVALYAPYPLSTTIPAMVVPHLLFFGPVEALGTALVVSYIYKYKRQGEFLMSEKRINPLWLVLGALIVLVPLGLLATGTAWGEWTGEELSRVVGYIPEGMRRLGNWKGILPGYGTAALAGYGFMGTAFLYIFSAALGSSIVVAAVYSWGRIWKNR